MTVREFILRTLSTQTTLRPTSLSNKTTAKDVVSLNNSDCYWVFMPRLAMPLA